MQILRTNTCFRSAGASSVSLCGALETTQRRKRPDYKVDKLSAIDNVAFSVCHTGKTKQQQNTEAAFKSESSVCPHVTYCLILMKQQSFITQIHTHQ